MGAFQKLVLISSIFFHFQSTYCEAGGMLNVVALGARGDGVWDDTAAFQSAFAQSGQIMIPPPPVEYRIRATLTLRSNQHILGAGTSVIAQMSPGLPVFMGNGVSNITIQGLVLKGTGSTSASTNGLISIYNGSSIRIFDNETRGYANGIACMTCQNLWIERNLVRDFGFIGIIASRSVNFHIDNNVIERSLAQGAAYSYGIQATGATVSGKSVQKQCTIRGNHISQVPTWAGIMTHDTGDLLITGNHISNVRNGIMAGPYASGNQIQNIRITDNHIEGTLQNTWGSSPAQNGGISVLGTSTVPANNVVVQGNVVKGFSSFPASYSPSGSGSIHLVNVKNASITGNSLSDLGIASDYSGGVYLSGISTGVSITGNTIRNTGRFGIHIRNGTVTNVSISSNVITNDAGGSLIAAVQVTDATVTGAVIPLNSTNLPSAQAYYQGGKTSVRGNVQFSTIAKINFPSVGGASGPNVQTIKIPFNGVNPGDSVQVAPLAAVSETLLWSAAVTAPNVLSVQCSLPGGVSIDPDGAAGGSYRLDISKH